MRVDDAGPRTLLLAAVAAWALLAWLLAAAGMGGRVQSLPDDPSLLRPLPPVRPVPAPRIGPLAQYEAIAARPLFSDDRLPQPFSLQGEDEQATAEVFDYVLTSVLITPRLKLAIVQPADGGESVRVRLDQAPESHPAWRLVGLGERSAVFEGPEGQRTLTLRVFDGVGGVRPTELGQDSAGRAPAGRADPAGAVDPAPPPAAEEAAEPDTDQAQMDAIRQRIQARRAKLRGEASPTRDMADPPPPPPPQSPSQPPANSP